jgi:Second Messenger Oligonucleotide or Dinucleotide Synthetase domain
METLSSQFSQAITNITVNGPKRARAIKAHTEIRALLETNPHLVSLGVDTVLIGSYARRTGIYPGKDVDVFVKLTRLDVGADPAEVFEAVCKVLRDHYGERVEVQHRSIKITFEREGDEFSVDAVPAVRLGDRWALPSHDRDLWRDAEERWIETDPERLGELTVARNRAPTVGGSGAYVPTVKLIRQIRSHHLGDAKPGGFYFELASFWAFQDGVTGSSHAEILTSTLRGVARRLASGADLTDPVLGRAYQPIPAPADLSSAAIVFDGLASQAEAALGMEACPAAAIWRRARDQLPRPLLPAAGGLRRIGPGDHQGDPGHRPGRRGGGWLRLSSTPSTRPPSTASAPN